MITATHSLTATERVLPKLALDFTTASLDSRVTFTRSGVATVTDSNGYIVSASADSPRFDYDPSSLECKGLLIEESRTNICYPSSVYNTGWANVNMTVSSATTTGPDGVSGSAEKIVPNTTSTQHWWQRSGMFTPDGSNRCWTVCVKGGEYRYVVIGHRTFASTSYTVIFDTQEGVYTNTGSSTYIDEVFTPIQLPNGWWKIGFRSDISTAGYNVFNIGVSSDGTLASFSGNDSDGLYAWGAQVEEGEFPTSYVPTTTANVTRNADVAVMTGTNFSDWFNASEGTYYGHGISFGTTAGRLLTFDDGSLNNQISSENAAGSLYAAGYIAPSNQYVFSSSGANKVCLGYKENNFAAAFNGGAIQTDTSGAVPTVNELQIGRRAYSLGLYWNGHIKNINYWPFRLTNSEIQAISKG